METAAFQRFFKKRGGYPKFKKKGVRDATLRWSCVKHAKKNAPCPLAELLVAWTQQRRKDGTSAGWNQTHPVLVHS
jgi:hypothetical protein